MVTTIIRTEVLTWQQLTERDGREWKLSAIDPHDRDAWRAGVRSAMRAASSCLEGGPLLWIWPLYLHVNQKSDNDEVFGYRVEQDQTAF